MPAVSILCDYPGLVFFYSDTWHSVFVYSDTWHSPSFVVEPSRFSLLTLLWVAPLLSVTTKQVSLATNVRTVSSALCCAGDNQVGFTCDLLSVAGYGVMLVESRFQVKT